MKISRKTSRARVDRPVNRTLSPRMVEIAAIFSCISSKQHKVSESPQFLTQKITRYSISKDNISTRTDSISAISGYFRMHEHYLAALTVILGHQKDLSAKACLLLYVTETKPHFFHQYCNYHNIIIIK
jgi:hypothetical protein